MQYSLSPRSCHHPCMESGREIAKYSERNAGAYPGFAVFSTVIQYQARTKNDPNILIGAKLTLVGTPALRRRVQNRRTLATNTQPSSMNPRPSLREVETTVKRCPFHDRSGHSLEECKAFAAKSLEEKTEWISKAKLCFRCFSGEHQASSCKRQIKRQSPSSTASQRKTAHHHKE